MCSRENGLDDFSKDDRRTKSTGAPTSSSASPAISSNSPVEGGRALSGVTSMSTSLAGVPVPRAAEPKMSSRRMRCFWPSNIGSSRGDEAHSSFGIGGSPSLLTSAAIFAPVTARFGPDGITIVDPNRTDEGAAKVFQRIYNGAV